MRYWRYVVAGLLSALAACSASGAIDEPKVDPGPPDGDAAPPEVEAAALDGGADIDAERPLVCGDAGFCETRLPTSDVGLPLSLRGVWVAGSNDVWSVTAQGFVLHYDGTSWTVAYRANHELHAVWATPTSVWVGGEAGLLFHRSSSGEWSRVEPGHVAPIRAIYGTADNDVWFTRNDSAVDHFDGTALTKHAIDVPGLRVTTVFGQVGFGVYAAGHVAASAPDAGIFPDQPYVFELSASNVAVFNPSLAEQRGFVPVSGFATSSVDPERRVFLVGYERSREPSGTIEEDQFYFEHCLFGGTNTVEIVKPIEPGLLNPPEQGNVSTHVREMSFPGLNNKPNNIRIPLYMWQVARWDGRGLTFTSLSMGFDFPPAPIFGAHSDATTSWIVGEGFALKGTP